MKPRQESQRVLSITRSKAKMFEYDVPEEHHIRIPQDPAKLFSISIGLLGDLAAAINRGELTKDQISELRSELVFSAQFFDSYLLSRLNKDLDSYLMLLGSASYYLCNLQGSASVLAKSIDENELDLNGDGLEILLLQLLRDDFDTPLNEKHGLFADCINGLSRQFIRFCRSGAAEDDIVELSVRLRKLAYNLGTPRQLLLSDIIAATLRKRLEDSVWNALPLHSGLPLEKWATALQKKSFIREFWQAQHLLGNAGILRGKSAVVQMPTSAGKTKAIELILQSAFLAERTSLAIVVAPFRALCHEIKDALSEAFSDEFVAVDELSDALQIDFDFVDILNRQQVLVMTPEKLLYVLRQNPDLTSRLGLLVFDEGHQFDNGSRGITYELLLTSLNSMIPEEAQKVLISAVINNAESIGEWLNKEPTVVDGSKLIPTFKSIGFVSWHSLLGAVRYVNRRDIEQEEYYVPRVIEEVELQKKGNERKVRTFPERDNGRSIALFLGFKLVGNGSVAVFCGTKLAVSAICKMVVDVIERGIPLPSPLEFSDALEVERLTYLYGANLGADAAASRCASYGIVAHHGNVPRGIRQAVEHAMREGFVKFVICTSTLAQGVNLPIRYLIVSDVQQGIERIKVRDFHNLIGRAGRAGIHTEGSILFANPTIFDKRRARAYKDRKHWQQIKALLEPSNSEPCVSILLSIFDPIKSDYGGRSARNTEDLSFAEAYINNPDSTDQFIRKILSDYGDSGFSYDGIKRQLNQKINHISEVESFLLSNLDKMDDEAGVVNLAESTLAFFLASDKDKELIREFFLFLSRSILEEDIDCARRKAYGRTLYGIRDAQIIEKWTHDNIGALVKAASEGDIFDLLWSMMTEYIHNDAFNKFDKKDLLRTIVRQWTDGAPYHELLLQAKEHDCKLGTGKRPPKITIEKIVDICEDGLAYDGALLIGAISECVGTSEYDETDDLLRCLHVFQKRLKYGLPTETTIALYELGFSDRVISQDIATSLSLQEVQKSDLISALRQQQDVAREIIQKYPSYFIERMNNYL